MLRILHFLALFGYLNVLCYEVKYCNIVDFKPVSSSETLLEVVLEEILDVTHPEQHENLPNIFFDDYRILMLILGVLPVILFFCWLVRKLFLFSKEIDHPAYVSKTLCLPGYYTFLYRFRPF
ncbi:hypothetical protein [Sphingobacterium paucimobilis]|uniref:Uncharacterized protein n=1 Tax=Sphingobacterium paucimobilis HER1398 TaxID=1346330 RepID=U2JEF3_9SPHI|nr:hypothetical protein [Sphingobacterium paucimobilis]ERJ61033.1 hypothetical protein M472_19990 [Sphingobacterium paucimobilis HER1398]